MSRGRGGHRWLVVWVAITVVVGLGAYLAGGLVRSPFADAARDAAQSPWTTTAVAERDFVASTANAKGSLSLGGALQIPVPVTSAARAVVTARGVEPGAPLLPGRMVAAVSGRPLFGLVLDIPMYRDLEPGTTGPDVEAVQRSLADLGLYRGRIDGDYGPGTSAAVAALYDGAAQEAPAKVPYVNAEPAPTTPQQDAAADETAEQEATADEPAPTPVVPTGVPLPMAEVTALPDGETVVVTIASVGQVLAEGDVLVSARTGRPFVTARASVADKDAYTAGAAVEVQIAGGDRFDAQIASVSEFRPATDEGDPPGYDLRVELDPAQLADSANSTDGAVVTVTPTAAGQAQHSLGLPLAAVRQVGDATVVVLADTGAAVPVTTGLVNDGWVQLVDAPDLAAGTKVRIGGPDGPVDD